MRGVDRVALVLASGLVLLVAALLVDALIQTTQHTTPLVRLSENVTQVLVGVVGGLVALLGTYVGYRVRDGHDDRGPDASTGAADGP